MSTTNFKDGVTNNDTLNLLGALKVPDASITHTYFNDFDVYNSGDWILTATQGGTTEAINNEDGGVLLLTNTTANNDLLALQLSKETFGLVAGKKSFFKARFQVSDATNSSLVIGLQILSTTPFSVSDGVYFVKNNASTSLNLVVEKSSTATTVSSIATLANSTYITVGFYYDGTYVNYFASTDSLNPTFLGRVLATNLPTQALTVSVAIENGAAASKTMSVDYILVSKER